MGVHGDLRGRVLGRADEDLLRGEHKVDGLAEALGIELAVLALEAHEVQAREVAGGVVQAHVLAAVGHDETVDQVRMVQRLVQVVDDSLSIILTSL